MSDNTIKQNYEQTRLLLNSVCRYLGITPPDLVFGHEDSQKKAAIKGETILLSGQNAGEALLHELSHHVYRQLLNPDIRTKLRYKRASEAELFRRTLNVLHDAIDIRICSEILQSCPLINEVDFAQRERREWEELSLEDDFHKRLYLELTEPVLRDGILPRKLKARLLSRPYAFLPLYATYLALLAYISEESAVHERESSSKGLTKFWNYVIGDRDKSGGGANGKGSKKLKPAKSGIRATELSVSWIPISFVSPDTLFELEFEFRRSRAKKKIGYEGRVTADSVRKFMTLRPPFRHPSHDRKIPKSHFETYDRDYCIVLVNPNLYFQNTKHEISYSLAEVANQYYEKYNQLGPTEIMDVGAVMRMGRPVFHNNIIIHSYHHYAPKLLVEFIAHSLISRPHMDNPAKFSPSLAPQFFEYEAYRTVAKKIFVISPVKLQKEHMLIWNLSPEKLEFIHVHA